MDLAARAEETSMHRISRDYEQPPITALTEVMVSADAYACMLLCMHTIYPVCMFVWGNNG